MKNVLFIAKVLKRHICVFHLPYLKWSHEQGYKVYVVAKNDYLENEENQLQYCDEFINVDFDRKILSKGNYKAYKQIQKILSDTHFDIIHCHTPAAGAITRLAARKTRKQGTKVIYTAHGFHFYKGAPLKQWMYYPIEKWLARFTDTLITINKEDYTLANTKFKTHVEFVNGVGVDQSRFVFNENTRIQKRNELGINDDTVMILSIGEIIKRKNHKVIIDAMAGIENPHVRFYIAGDGEDRQKLERYVEKHNLQTKVVFLGHRFDIPELLNATDIFAFPSIHEGLPIALIEAMFSQKPLICSNIRGNNDLVIDGENGIMVTYDNVEGYLHGIEVLINNPELAINMGKMNYRIAQNYDTQKVLQEMIKVYNKTLQGDDFHETN